MCPDASLPNLARRGPEKDVCDVPFPLYHRADNEVAWFAQTDDAESIAGR